MKQYKTNAIVTITDGSVMLNEDQARRRRHKLKPTDKENVFEIMQPIQFKAGEVFGYDGELSKTYKSIIDDLDELKAAEAEAAAKAEAEKETQDPPKKKSKS